MSVRPTSLGRSYAFQLDEKRPVQRKVDRPQNAGWLDLQKIDISYDLVEMLSASLLKDLQNRETFFMLYYECRSWGRSFWTYPLPRLHRMEATEDIADD